MTKRARTAAPKYDETTGTWGYVFDLGPDPTTGKRRQVRRRGFRRKMDAQSQLDADRRAKDDGTFVARAAGDVRLADFVNGETGWLASIRTTVEPSTWESYDRMIRLHVIPRIGQVRLNALTPQHLNTLYADLLDNGRRDGNGGLSARSVRYLHTILHRMLRDAGRWGQLARNVADLADPPSAKSARAPESNVWTPEQVSEFLDTIRDEPLYLPVRLVALTGLRRGEVYGLLWSDLDLDAGTITIRRQMRVVRGALDHVEITKTSAGRRTIDVGPETVTLLRSHRVRQDADRLAAGLGRGPDRGFVFAEPDGSPVDPDSASKMFAKRVARSGLPRVRFHDLRHTHATHLLASGYDPKLVSTRLGHSSTSFTLDRYGHVLAGHQAAAAAAVEALLDG